MRTALALFFVVLCILDNLLTYQLTNMQGFQEIAPVAMLMLSVPYGLWIQKIVACFCLYCFRSKISNTFLSVLSAAMLLIVTNNAYFYFTSTQ